MVERQGESSTAFITKWCLFINKSKPTELLNWKVHLET